MNHVSRGYTLIEVMAVLLILALAAGVVAPSVGRGLDGIRLRAEVAGVASFLRAAREQAVTHHTPYEVTVEPESRLLVLRVSGHDPARGADGVRATKRLSAIARIEAEPAARTVFFFPEGWSSGGRFRIAAPGPLVYVVTVDALTGRVTTRQSGS